MESQCSWFRRAFACSALRCLRVSLVAEFCICWSRLSLGRKQTFENKHPDLSNAAGHGRQTRRKTGHGAMLLTVQTWTCDSDFNVFMGNSFRTTPVVCLVNTVLNARLPKDLEVRIVHTAQSNERAGRSVGPSATIREEKATTQSTS